MNNRQYPFFNRLYFVGLLPLFFIFHGYTENFPLVPVPGSLYHLFKYLVAAAILTVLSFIVLRSWRLSVFYSFLIILFQIFFGPFHDVLKNWFPDIFISRYSFLIPFFIILFIIILVYLRRKRPTLGAIPQYLNLLFIVFIVIDLARLVIKISSEPARVRLSEGLTACDTCAKPDIYLLVADGYAGKKSLEEVFGFDNSSFENELKKRAFYTVNNSISNYNFTPFSIASMLSLDYLTDLEGRNKSLSDRNLCYRKINNNEVSGYLKYHGYDFRNCSIFQFAGKLPFRSTPYYLTGMDLVTAQTFISRVKRDLGFNLVTRFKIQSETDRVLMEEFRINEELYKRTMEAASEVSTQPKFVYTHLEMPHYPYYFDRNGKPNELKDLGDVEPENLKNYLEYLQYANKKYLQLIDHILKQSKNPPVIFLMSDHGFREFKNDSVDHSYHFMNINAIHLPLNNYSGFYNGMSNVNHFRVFLNSQFQQQLPMLKDSTSFLKE